MNIGPITHRCGICGEQWWDAHCCPKQKPPMTVAGFFDEAKRLNLRMLGTPEETRAALDLKDAEIARLREALQAMVDCSHTMDVHCCARASQLAAAALGPNVGAKLETTAPAQN